MLTTMGQNLKEHITETSNSLKEVGTELKDTQLASVKDGRSTSQADGSIKD